MSYPNYGGYPPQYNGPQHQSVEVTVAKAMRLVYLKMCAALVVTGLVAWFFQGASFLYSSGAMIGLIIAEFALVIGISAGINRLSSPMATVLFYLFAVVNGLMLSSIFLVYDLTSLAKTFFITAGTFGAMSVYGYTTSQDLTKMGNILFMALIGLIICSIVNLIWPNGTLSWIISAAGVLIFVGLTAWDTQTIKRMAAMTPGENVGRLATIGALSLYLDFINLFLYLLRFFGGSRD